MPATTDPKVAEASTRQVVEASIRKTVIVPDPHTGRWIEKEITDEADFNMDEDIDLASIDPNERDPTDIIAQWNATNRGDAFECRWLNNNPAYHARERSLGWAPVDPKTVRPALAQFATRDLPGLGVCIVYGDIFLCEMPRRRAEALRAAAKKRMDKDERERRTGISDADRDLEDRAEGLVKIERTYGDDEEEADRVRRGQGRMYGASGDGSRNHVQDQIDSVNDAFERMRAENARIPR